MTKICHILSPHYDDACISLGISIAALRKAGYDIHLINCFSQSDHAPFSSLSGTKAVSSLRGLEDSLFREIVGIRRVTNLGLLDAPLRGYAANALFTLGDSSTDPAETDRLTKALSTLVPSGLLAVPLGIGHHVDHIIARDAAFRLENVSLGCYEDLPYAARISSNQRATFARRITHRLGRTLVPGVCRANRAVEFKMQLLSAYKSQFAECDLALVRDVTLEYGEGERLWADAEFRASVRDVVAWSDPSDPSISRTVSRR